MRLAYRKGSDEGLWTIPTATHAATTFEFLTTRRHRMKAQRRMLRLKRAGIRARRSRKSRKSSTSGEKWPKVENEAGVERVKNAEHRLKGRDYVGPDSIISKGIN